MSTKTASTGSTEPLFRSAHAALKFAVNFSMSPERPAMNRAYRSPISDGIPSSGNGLAGLDGAAQAGIITAKMKALGEVSNAILEARVAKRTVECACRRPCCSGSMINPTWQSAINRLADEIGPLLKGRYMCHAIRSLLVARLFGDSATLKAIGEKYDCSEDTLQAHNARIKRWLNGQKKTAISEVVKGSEQEAWEQIETLLRESTSDDGHVIVG